MYHIKVGVDEMGPLSDKDYKKILDDLQALETKISSLNELRFVLNKLWFNRVSDVINCRDNQFIIDDGAFDLIYILSKILKPIILNKRLEKIEAIAREQSRLRSYRKTRGELASTQKNQIFGSLFEINIVYAALESCSSVEVFPKAGKGGSEVEAKLIIDNNPVFIEAKALTSSKYDIAVPYSGYLGSHPVDSMIRQIYDALNEKLAQGKQLQILSNEFPTVLFLALGLNADEISEPWGIELYFEEYRSNVSSVFLFESPLCLNLIKEYHNKSTFPLSQKELEVFKNTFCRAIANNAGT